MHNPSGRTSGAQTDSEKQCRLQDVPLDAAQRAASAARCAADPGSMVASQVWSGPRRTGGAAPRPGHEAGAPLRPKAYFAFAPRGALSRIRRSRCIRMWAASADVLASNGVVERDAGLSCGRPSCIRNAPRTPKKWK